MQKVAVLYICTGKYEVFWRNFYESAQRYLLPAYEKHYFVFTDAQSIYDEDSVRVHKIYQEALPWPYPTLFRFRFFKSIETQLQLYDYIYFFNSNIKILREISSEEFLPKDDEMVVTQHPYFWNKKSNNDFTYDRNPNSRAYIPYDQGSIYVAGGLSGSTSKRYMDFINTCYNYTEEDCNNNIIALWHDESYLNKYILDKKIKVLHPGFLYPAETTIPFEKVIHLESKKELLKGYGKFEKTQNKTSWLKRILGRNK